MALHGDDEIDSLLALMGGETVEQSTVEQVAVPSISKTKKKHKKKRKRSYEPSTKKKVILCSSTFADTRLSQSCFLWPSSTSNQSLLYLGGGILHDCSSYGSQDDASYGSSCVHCGKSAATHELYISSSWAGGEDDASKACHPLSLMAIAALIVAARNTRCMIGEYHTTNAKEKIKQNDLLPPLNSIPACPEMISNTLDVYVGKILVLVKRMQRQPKKYEHENKMQRDYRKLGCIASISSSDAQLLQGKTSTLISSVQAYKKAIAAIDINSIPKNTNAAINIIETRLSAISSCDALYYRCYYAAAVSPCATDKGVDGSNVASIIPHPPTYFSCPGLAWDSQAGVEALRIFAGDTDIEDNRRLAAPLDDSTKQVLFKSCGLEERMSPKAGMSTGAKSNPLLTLWQSRFLETVRHVWCTRYCMVKSSLALGTASESANVKNVNTPQPILSDTESILKLHETTALSLAVSEWRDSARDYPANFYAYATPTNEALHAIITACIESTANIEQILEAGAGSGYWSLLVSHFSSALGKEKDNNSRVPKVIAYDIRPPSSEGDIDEVNNSNEYHGNIPTFTEVHQADTLSHVLSSAAKTSSANTALLLCYPPPGSEMAYDALTTHTSSGGRVVIHIGEWQGLTSNTAFEEFLKQKFFCAEKDVVPLPLWGTDAAYLTIWRKKSEGNSCSPAIGFCSAELCTNQAIRRCRYARKLQYCGLDCYQKHFIQRGAILAMHMIHAGSGDEMSYEDDGHFVDIKHITAKRRDEHHSSEERKKRKKKRRRHR